VTTAIVSLKNLGPHSVTGKKGQWEGHTRGNNRPCVWDRWT